MVRLGRHLSALAATGIALLAGIWLMVAPWVLGYPQPVSAWGAETLTDFWSGLGIAAVAVISLMLYGGALSAELRRAGVVIAPPPRPASPDASLDGLAPGDARATAQRVDGQQGAGATAGDLDQILLPMATALLADLVKRRAGAENMPSTSMDQGDEQG